MKYFNQLSLNTAFLIASLFSTAALAAEDQYFDSNGVNIRYQALGSGTPVILLHGYMGGFNPESLIVDVLTPHFQVIGIDARGHGKSGKPHDADAYGIQMVTDVVNLMDHLDIDKAHVAGYSMGGYIALKMASIYPDRLYSAMTGGNGVPIELGTGTLHPTNMQKAIDENISVVDLYFPPEIELPPALEERRETWLSIDMNPRALLAVHGGMGQLLISLGDAAAIHVPLLAIVGSLDTGGVESVERLRAAAPNTEVIVIEGEDHLSTFPTPTFALALRDYLLSIGE